ncbi:hypothetical protein EZV62_006747 [Acer yangbiense]|uniref:Protein kinase domain-containing protein n=1 Tax=Acer yangbiense TaxID=1000413 RepID=A0A5C7I9V4_9ROSI|nr:hypothetical protein EZV62_006747 [Acer yangbiense]
MEISHTFAYLHIGFPRPIVYSFMSPSKFLLDEHCVPKLFDFSNAQCIPEGETQIKDAQLRGTFGYIAPEHMEGVLDEKSDVYGFGNENLLRHDFVKNINGENWFIVVVDPTIIGDGICPETRQQIQVFLELVVIKCLSLSGGDRPSMIDVAKQLKQLYLSASA